MYAGKSNTLTSDLLRNPLFLFGLLCLAFLGLKKVAGLLRFGAPGDQAATYNYEMARGKDAKPILTVDDYPTVVRGNSWTPPTNRNPMSGDPVKKTIDGPAAKGQAAATKKGTIAGAAKAQQQQRRKPRVKVDVIGKNAAKSGGSDEAAPVSMHNDVVFYGAPPLAVSEQPAKADKDDEKTMSLNEWRALLTTPTRQNMDRLLAARRANQITTNDFYALVKELVLSHADDRQKAGVYALQNDLTAAGFEFIVLNKAQAMPAVQTQLAALQKKFEEPSQANELAKLLAASKAPEVLNEAMKSLAVAVAALKKQVAAQGDTGGTRNPAVAAQAKRDLFGLMPALRRMAGAGGDLAGMASGLLNEIESLSDKA